MHITRDESRGTVKLKAKDPQDRMFIWNFRRLIEPRKVLRFKKAEDLRFTGSRQGRLILRFELPGSLENNLLIGTSDKDDEENKKIEKSIVAAKTGLVYIRPIIEHSLAGIEVTIGFCKRCRHPIIRADECHSGHCWSCISVLNKRKPMEAEARRGIISLEWFQLRKKGWRLKPD